FDAYGVTPRGFSCDGHEFDNREIYAQVNFACMGGKLNSTITNDVKVRLHFASAEEFVVGKLRDAKSTGAIHLAPLFRKDVKYMQDTFINQNKDVGPYRLVLNEYCDVVSAITYKYIRNEAGHYSTLDIHNCNKF
ncbi:hypothetical protein GcM3_111027, partial [Golovinomyces cichoracearum]